MHPFPELECGRTVEYRVQLVPDIPATIDKWGHEATDGSTFSDFCRTG